MSASRAHVHVLVDSFGRTHGQVRARPVQRVVFLGNSLLGGYGVATAQTEGVFRPGLVDAQRRTGGIRGGGWRGHGQLQRRAVGHVLGQFGPQAFGVVLDLAPRLHGVRALAGGSGPRWHAVAALSRRAHRTEACKEVRLISGRLIASLSELGGRARTRFAEFRTGLNVREASWS